jgi:hypothetical protein
MAARIDDLKLRPLPLHTPALSEQIEAIRLVRARMPPDVPLVMTVFLPLDVADKLVNRDGALILRHLEENEAAVRSGLDAIAETFTRFVAAVGRGVLRLLRQRHDAAPECRDVQGDGGRAADACALSRLGPGVG